MKQDICVKEYWGAADVDVHVRLPTGALTSGWEMKGKVRTCTVACMTWEGNVVNGVGHLTTHPTGLSWQVVSWMVLSGGQMLLYSKNIWISNATSALIVALTYTAQLQVWILVSDLTSSCLDWWIHQCPLLLPLTRLPYHPLGSWCFPLTDCAAWTH